MQRLKAETKPFHDQVEGKAFSKKIMDGSLSYAQYQELIFGNYLFHCVIEEALQNVLSEEEQLKLNLSKRLKKAVLEEELTLMGFHLFDNSQLPEIKLNDFYEALGALYVMEGSTLGGAMIKKILMKNPTISQQAPLLFYGCYGEMIGKYWKDFVGVMNDLVQTLEQEDKVVKKAIDAFNIFGTCLEVAKQGIGISAS